MLRSLPSLRRYLSSCGCQKSFQRHAFTLMYGQNGNPTEVLVGKDVPVPDPAENEILVKMVAAPIHPADVNVIQGVYGTKAALPAVPGTEGVGIVEAVGSKVTKYKLGDHVLPYTMQLGVFRTHLLGTGEDFMQIDARVPFISAATVHLNPGTALQMLRQHGAARGDTVLQNGANSAVGQSVIQIGRIMGVKTVNVLRDREDFQTMADYLTSLGADYVIKDSELKKPEVKELLKTKLKPPKLMFDCVAGTGSTDLLRHIAPGGVLVNYGGMSKRPVMAPVGALIFKEATIRGFWFSQWRERSPRAEVESMIDELCQMLIDKQLLPQAYDLVHISEFKKAFEKTMTPFLSEKQILVMDDGLLQ